VKIEEEMALLQASKSGDAAFEELVKRYDRKLLRVAEQVTQNHEDAEDVVQETFLKVFQKLDQFEGRSTLWTWLFRIGVNESRMKLRKRRSLSELPILDDSLLEIGFSSIDIPDSALNPEEACQVSELREILLKTLRTLAPRLRVVFFLRDVEGLTSDQTAAALDLHQSAVKARLRRARLQLRERLGTYH